MQSIIMIINWSGSLWVNFDEDDSHFIFKK